MSGRSNVETVKAFFVAQYAGEFDKAFREYVHPEFKWVVSSANNDELRSAIPWAGYELLGRDGYVDLTRMLFGEFESLSFEARRYVESDSVVFVEGHFRFRHSRTGKIADSDWLARFDMREGRIAGGQFYENTFAVAAARA